MSAFTVIRDVTRTLDVLLTNEVGVAVDSDRSPAEIAVVAPLISLFLYRIERNPSFANLGWQPGGTAAQLVAPPFGLNLHYLICAYGPTQVEIHATLGEVMRVLHDHAVIRADDPVLDPNLAAMTEELKIVPHNLSLPDTMELWKSFERVPFRLSLAYEVSVVVIDSAVTRTVRRVQERRVEVEQLR
ncbi:MAG: DUF4255 domain-containing protein [Burkholderiales bacterium]|nr:DUF4255 domain-containing protein [Burkholderiales bacterium]